MKGSIGYTVSLNIIMVFIVIVFAFIGVSVSYYKAFKVNNVIADSIEKFEGYNDAAIPEISKNLSSIGYDMSDVNCNKKHVKGLVGQNNASALEGSGKGYCVYYSVHKPSSDKTELVGEDTYYQAEEYNYIIKTYIKFNVPIINSVLKFPVYTKTRTLYGCYGNNCKE